MNRLKKQLKNDLDLESSENTAFQISKEMMSEEFLLG